MAAASWLNLAASSRLFHGHFAKIVVGHAQIEQGVRLPGFIAGHQRQRSA
jgi:hypothetical protein